MEKVVTVWLAANKYQEASILCREEGLDRPAAINAALAIEIYLKSLSSIEYKIPTGIDNIYQSVAETEWGHDLVKLFSKIDHSILNIMDAKSKEIDHSIELKVSLEKFKDVFAKARYSYEKDSITLIDMRIVDLAEHFRKLVESVGRDVIG